MSYVEMFIPASIYWNVVHGMTPEEVLQDAEGCQAIRVLGKNIAYLMKSLEYSNKAIPAPEKERKVMTNFIR